MRSNRILNYLSGRPLFMDSAKMEEILLFLELRANSVITAEDAKSRIEPFVRHVPSVNQGLGIIPIEGVLSNKMNIMSSFSGGTSYETIAKDVNMMANDDSIATIILQFDTPGGQGIGLPECGNVIWEASRRKPVIAVASMMACSAGYWLASQATRVYASPSSIIGSVGGFILHFDRSEALKMEGQKPTLIKAGAFKAEGLSEFPLSQETIAYYQTGLNEVLAQFHDAISRARDIPIETIADTFGKGRSLTAAEAMDVGMIDGILTLEQVIETEAAQLLADGRAIDTVRVRRITAAPAAELTSLPSASLTAPHDDFNTFEHVNILPVAVTDEREEHQMDEFLKEHGFDTLESLATHLSGTTASMAALQLHVEELEKSLSALTAEKRGAEIDLAVLQAKATGKVNPRNEDFVRKLASENPTLFTDFLAMPNDAAAAPRGGLNIGSGAKPVSVQPSAPMFQTILPVSAEDAELYQRTLTYSKDHAIGFLQALEVMKKGE